MTRWLVVWLLLLTFLVSLPAGAQTRAWLDRASIYDGETVALNVETEQPLSQLDFSPLRSMFEIGGQGVRRSYSLVNGRSATTSVFSVGLRPRELGTLLIPSLRVGTARTQPLQLTVLPAPEPRAEANADIFVETEVDALQPYVQQTVGVTVRLNYAVPLASGQLDLAAPENASLQRVGDDVSYQRSIGGRSFQTIERRFMLIPERSGPLMLSGARFNGTRAGGFFDPFADSRDAVLAAAAPSKRLQVLPIPAGAPQPWLPLHQLTLRYLQAPRQAWVGQAVTVEIEAMAEGATAAQMPEIAIPPQRDAQVFADPPRMEEAFVDGRPRAVLRRTFSIIPQQPGALRVQGPHVAWWNAAQHRPDVAALPALTLEVAPGVAGSAAPVQTQRVPMALADAAQQPSFQTEKGNAQGIRWWLWLAVGLAVLLAVGVGYIARGRVLARKSASVAQQPTLVQALQHGDLGEISAALSAALGLATVDLEAVMTKLADVEQLRAVRLLQAARWGGGDPKEALQLLRKAFAAGVVRDKTKQRASSLLPPLYPE